MAGLGIEQLHPRAGTAVAEQGPGSGDRLDAPALQRWFTDVYWRVEKGSGGAKAKRGKEGAAAGPSRERIVFVAFRAAVGATLRRLVSSNKRLDGVVVVAVAAGGDLPALLASRGRPGLSTAEEAVAVGRRYVVNCYAALAQCLRGDGMSSICDMFLGRGEVLGICVDQVCARSLTVRDIMVASHPLSLFNSNRGFAATNAVCHCSDASGSRKRGTAGGPSAADLARGHRTGGSGGYPGPQRRCEGKDRH